MKHPVRLFGALLLSAMLCSCGEGGDSPKRSNPVLTCSKTALDRGFVGEVYTLPSVSALDEVDGDLSGQVKTSVISPLSAHISLQTLSFTPSVAGDYAVKYSVINTANLVASLSFTLTVDDYSAPVLTCEKETLDPVTQGETFTLPSVTCTDAYDGTIADIDVSVLDANQAAVALSGNSFVASVVGPYTITWSATNSKGKSASLLRTLRCVADSKPILSADVAKVNDIYLKQTVTLPHVTVTDASDPSCTSARLTVIDPAGVQEPCSAATYTPKADGTYTLHYEATNSFGKTGTLDFAFSVKKAFVIGYDARIYTTGASGLTPAIMEDFETELSDYLKGQDAENVAIVMRGYAENSDAALGTAITGDGDCDLLIGFTQKIYTEAGSNVPCLEHKTKAVANVAGRYICLLTDMSLSRNAFNWIMDGSDDLFANRVIRVAWLSEGVTDAIIENATDAMDAFLVEKGYSGISFAANRYERDESLTPSSASYQAVHDAIVADGCSFAINWPSNFKVACSSDGYGFTGISNSGSTARLLNVGTIGSQEDRYVAGFVKKNGSLYAFYDDIFTFLTSDAMKAIYNPA